MLAGTFAAYLVLAQPLLPTQLSGVRVDRGGWIFVHVEGTPGQVGFQHGSLLSHEIEDALRALKVECKRESRKSWEWFRATSYRLFWDKLEPEYRAEIEGIAQGAISKGIKVDYRDVLAMNAHIEVGGYYLPALKARQSGAAPVSKAPSACSAFVATGHLTTDRKVVMGHNFWWSYFMGGRWKVLLDIKPERGHRFIMDTLPGLIHSGTDWAQNDAGILITETTISGFSGFDEKGLPEFMRMRKAAQYSSSLDDARRHFVTGNNGGYANTWLLADVKTGEIAKLELGLKNVSFSRTKDGAYYGSNFPENPNLIQEEIHGYDPKSPKNGCELRRARWKALLAKYEGKIDAERAKRFLEDTYNSVTGRADARGSALCGRFLPGAGAVNAKVTTSMLALEMKLWARMGAPDGTSIQAKKVVKQFKLRGAFAKLYPDIPAHPWAVFQGK